MNKYPSIETVWKRDKVTNKLNFGEIRLPVNDQIKHWSITEKVDGTNIRILFTEDGMEIRGRTDNAQLSPGIEAHIRSIIDPVAVRSVAESHAGKALWEGWNLTICGEAYGAGIQSGGNYSATKKFVAFDVLLSNRFWLKPADFDIFCDKVGIPRVPDLGIIDTLPVTKEELDALIPFSVIAETPNAPAEGVVAKPLENLFDEFGDRIMWKLTKREWK